MANKAHSVKTSDAAAGELSKSIAATPDRAGGNHTWRLPLLLAAVGLAYFLVHFDKPVHIDDTQYVYAARHLLVEPWCPLCHQINWQKAPVPAYRDLINPPAYIYLQAGWIAVFGDSIRGLHVLSIVMAMLAAVCGFLVARRFTRHAALATALVLFSPNVLPIANVMVDVPSLAVSLAAVAVFVSAVDRGRRGRATLGGLLAGLALLTKYNTIVLLPLLALYALLRGRGRYVFFLAIPVAMLGLWCVHNLIVYGELHLAITAAYEAYEKTPQKWWENVYTALLVPGSSFVFLGVLATARVRFRGLSILAPLAVLLLLGPMQMVWWRPSFPAAIYWAFALNTIILVAFAAATGQRAVARRRDDVFLWLWAGGVMLFQVLFAYHQAPRYHILALLPLALLLVRTLESTLSTWRRRHLALAWGSVGLECLIALFVAAADDAHARANRDYPSYVEQRYGAGASRIFCIGHWGLQFYCQERGFSAFDAIRGDVRKDDLLIVASNNYPANMPREFRPLPAGTPACDQTPLFELVQDVAYPQDRATAPLSPTDGFFGTWLLARLHRVRPFSVSPLHDHSLYATRLPKLPYSWQPRGDRPDERFFLLRARCDYKISTETLSVDFASEVDRVRLIAGWGPAQSSDAGTGAWGISPLSRLEVVLDHRNRAYVLRISGKAGQLQVSQPVNVAVAVNGVRIGELVFTSEQSTQELRVPAATLAEWESAIDFIYHTPRPLGEQTVFFLGIELLPLG